MKSLFYFYEEISFARRFGIIIYFLVYLILRAQGPAADTVHITMENVERKFLRENLQLLASKFNIGAAEAAIVQARLWSNPNISIEQNIYNQDTKRYFDFTSTGNTEVQIQQLFLLAGKRNHQIQLATIGKEISEYSFSDLLRTLKLELRSHFYDLFYQQQTLKFYNESIPAVKKAISSIEGVYENRSILLSEVLRLKALLLSLETDRLGYINQVAQFENDLHVLLNESVRNNIYYVADADTSKLEKLSIVQLNLDYLVNAALENRPDYKIVSANVRTEETNLKLQNALAVPDLTIAARWSRQGSYIYDYYALSFSIDLPLLNRNQGNILVSKNNLEADKKMQDQAKLNVEREVTEAYNKAMETDKLYKSFDKKFTTDYKKLVAGMISNYQRRFITIIEFTDFYDAYRSGVIQMNQLQSSRVDAFENLNFKTGIDIIKYR